MVLIPLLSCVRSSERFANPWAHRAHLAVPEGPVGESDSRNCAAETTPLIANFVYFSKESVVGARSGGPRDVTGGGCPRGSGDRFTNRRCLDILQTCY